jgi:WD40 repeat protein
MLHIFPVMFQEHVLKPEKVESFKEHVQERKKAYNIIVSFMKTTKVVTGSADGKINVYSETLVLVKSFVAHSSGMITRVLYVNPGYILTASSDYTINIWDTNNNWSLYGTYIGHTNEIQALISISDTVMLSGGADTNLRQWTLSNGSFSTTSLVYPTAGTCCGGGATFTSAPIYGICYVSSLNKIALTLSNSMIQLYAKDVSTIDGKLDRYTSAGITYGHATGSLIYDCVTVGSSYIATCASDSYVIIWDVPNYMVKYTLTGHTSMVLGLRFWPASNYLASGSWDGTVRLWDVASGTLVRSLSCTGGIRGGIDFLNSSSSWVISDNANKMSIVAQANGSALQTLSVNSEVRTLVVISGERRRNKIFPTL